MAFVEDIFFVLAGVSLSIGLLSLLVGLYIKISKIYLYFGIFSIGAGLHYLIFNLVDPSSTAFLPKNRLLISSALIYYVFPPGLSLSLPGPGRKCGRCCLARQYLPVTCYSFYQVSKTNLSPGR